MFYYSVPGPSGSPGFCLVSDRFLCAVGADAEHDYLMALWDVLQRDESRLEDVLTFFAGQGISRLPGFALVELVDVPTGSVVLAVRGDAQVEILGRESEPYLGAGAATWVEGAAQSVDRLSIGFRGAPADAVELPLHRGIVRSDRLVWRTRPDAAPPALEDADEFTEIPAWAREPEASPTPDINATAAIDRAAFELDDEDDHTVVMGMRPGSAPVDDDFDATIVSMSRPSLIDGSAPATVHLRLSLPDGTAVDLTRPVLVGRRPKIPLASAADTRLVTVSSPTNEVSSTHIEFTLHEDAVLVRDADSTNGSIIRIPGKEPYLLKAGESVSVPDGTAIDIGDSNLVTVLRG